MTGTLRRILLASASLLMAGLPTLAAVAPPAHASPAVCTGTLQVTNTDNHTVIGFVSKTWNSFGEFVVTTTPSDYLSVSMTPGTSIDITALNGQNSSFPLVGGIVGFANTSDNLGTGSFNYAYLGGTTHTAAGATPQSGANAFTSATGIPEDIESAIWTVADNNSMTVQWVNTDAGKPATHLMDITGILVMTGDTTAFQNTFGPAADVALTFIPAGSCAHSGLALTALPANITVPATSVAGATVTYTPPTSVDAGGPTHDATVSCLPASGSVFPIGTTTVTCTATDPDDSPSSASGTFTVTVTANLLVLSGVPGNITTNATQLGGATVTYTPPTAVDEAGGSPPPTVSCTPASGSVFALGTTTVTCTATDANDFNSPLTATFTVTVVPAPLDHLVLAPATATINAGHSKTYTARGADQFGNDRGDLTAATTFTIDNGGTCTANVCTGPPGTHTVTGTTGSPAVHGTATLTVTKAPTTTVVSASPTTPAFGAPVTFVATVAPSMSNPSTPTGTVSFFLDGSATPVATVPLSGTTATITFSGLGAGGHTVTARYNGDSTFAASSSSAGATVNVTCTTTIVGGVHGALPLGPGSTCIVGGTINGSIVVPKGSSLDLEGVAVSGSVTANGTAFLRICGSTMTAVTVNNSTGFVVIGDATDGCAINTLRGSLTLQNNTGGVQAIGNHVGGAVTASGNTGAGPFPDDLAPKITGNGH